MLGWLINLCLFEKEMKLETQIYLNIKYEKPLLLKEKQKACEKAKKTLRILDILIIIVLCSRGVNSKDKECFQAC